MPMDYKATLQRAAEKFRASATLAAAEGLIPYKSEEGRWIPSPYDGNSWWTGGFWPGLMWQCYAATQDEAFLREARESGASPSPSGWSMSPDTYAHITTQASRRLPPP